MTVVQSVKGINVIDVDTICGIWGVLGILFIIAKIGDITIMFNDDALGSIAEEHEKEKRVLEGVLGISQSIRTESVKSGELIEKLVGVTESVTNSMQEISASANTTAGSIEEQSTMTNSIQDAIGVTGESSKQMVDIAMNSNESIQENIRVMEELRTQSELITKYKPRSDDRHDKASEQNKRSGRDCRNDLKYFQPDESSCTECIDRKCKSR